MFQNLHKKMYKRYKEKCSDMQKYMTSEPKLRCADDALKKNKCAFFTV